MSLTKQPQAIGTGAASRYAYSCLHLLWRALMGIFSFFCCTRNKSPVPDDHSKPAALPDSKPVTSRNAGKPESYSEGRARQLFKTYEDPDTPGEIGPEGFEKLCTDLDISLEGPLPLVLAWQMQTAEMARFKEAEWLKGTGELRYVLLLHVELLWCYWGAVAVYGRRLIAC